MLKRAQVAGAVDDMVSALFKAADEKDPSDVRAITFTMTPTDGNGDVRLVASDPVFEAWKAEHCREEYDSEDAEAADFCEHCSKSPCVWIKNQDHVDAIKRSCEGERNIAIRFQLYAFFTRSIHGTLGKGNRIPLPTCVGRFITSQFPNEDGEVFVGFKPGNEPTGDKEEE